MTSVTVVQYCPRIMAASMLHKKNKKVIISIGIPDHHPPARPTPLPRPRPPPHHPLASPPPSRIHLCPYGCIFLGTGIYLFLSAASPRHDRIYLFWAGPSFYDVGSIFWGVSKIYLKYRFCIKDDFLDALNLGQKIDADLPTD